MKESLEFYKEHLTDIVMTGLTKEEQETVIIRTRTDRFINVETSLPSDFTIFRKRTLNGDWELTGVEVASDEPDPLRIVSARFIAPKNLLSFRSANRAVTEEQRAAVIARFAKKKG